MFKKAIILLLLICFFRPSFVLADEGMWIPILLKKYNYEDMQKKGFRLTPEDIYSINKASMKDAIVIFGGGCTGELISDKGLLITNHHCGYSFIQKHSSLENDYLTDGFWAMSQEEELTNPGLTVTFLVRMEDVTDRVFSGISEGMDAEKRMDSINVSIDKIIKEATDNSNYTAEVVPFYYGNEYYLFVYEIYKDIRLVGAPPSAIGKFGGDTDNWMWPRHTGDFSLFRIYAGKDNNPAEYSPDNVPYKPKKYFPISLKGVKKGDFTMVFGYPGSTSEYLTSYAVRMITEVENPHRIKLREKRLDIFNAAMNTSREIRIKYATKHARVSNYWKKWIGENRGLQRFNAIEKKEALEQKFTTWAFSAEKLKMKYGNILPMYSNIYNELTPYTLAVDYYYEVVRAIEILRFAEKFNPLFNPGTFYGDNEAGVIESIKNRTTGFFKDYYMPVDKKIFAELLQMYYENIDKEFHPGIFSVIEQKYKGDFSAYADFVFSKSFLVNENKINGFLDNCSEKSYKKLIKDPAYRLYDSFVRVLREKVIVQYRSLNNRISELDRIYMQGLREMQKDKLFYPDANSTIRVSYGQVDDYCPRDAVYYEYYTTLKGIIEKDDPDVYDYKVPEKLKELYRNGDFGQYGEGDEMHVCFIASNHTSGGNSGSPVINGDGYLIGVNFDRNWEGTMSDIMYDPDICRNISLDIRYALFIIDKFAGATHLIEEMTLVK